MDHRPASEQKKDAQRSLDSIRRIVRELRLTDARTQSRTGISSAQLFVLSRIADKPAKSMSELAGRTFSDRSSVAALVRRMQQRGFVKVSAGRDRRTSTIGITPAGKALVRREPHPPGEKLLSAMLLLPRTRLRQLAQSLGMLVDAMGIGQSAPAMLFTDESTRKRAPGKKKSQ